MEIGIFGDGGRSGEGLEQGGTSQCGEGHGRHHEEAARPTEGSEPLVLEISPPRHSWLRHRSPTSLTSRSRRSAWRFGDARRRRGPTTGAGGRRERCVLPLGRPLTTGQRISRRSRSSWPSGPSDGTHQAGDVAGLSSRSDEGSTGSIPRAAYWSRPSSRLPAGSPTPN